MFEFRLHAKCYFASPFFNEEQVEREESLKRILRTHNVALYSPKENGIVSVDSTDSYMKKIFDDNVMHLQICDIVFVVTDGKDVGTIWEAGYAYALNKPIIYFCETLGDNPFNIMLGQSGTLIYKSRENLIKDLERYDIMDLIRGHAIYNEDQMKGY